MKNSKEKSGKLTKRFVEGVAPVKTGEILRWDSELKGFGIRVFPTGRKTYFIQYRNESSRTRRRKIGVHGVLTAEQARAEAKKLLGDIAKGEDPSEDYKKRKKISLFSEFAGEYLSLYAKGSKKKTSFDKDKAYIENILTKRFGSQNIQEINTLELQRLHRDLEKTPYQANRIRSLLSKMFSLAIKWGYREDNPALNIERYQEHKRTRLVG